MRIVSAGEVMVEMASADGVWLQHYGGDTFNTAVYLAREGMQVQYLTALGDDRFSRDILALLQSESVATDLIEVMPGRQPGLYTIHNDPSGEREFSYWRENSPARERFDAPVVLSPAPDLFYFSGITLAVIRSGGEHFLALLKALFDSGCHMVFDPNYRPRLWANVDQARSAYREVLPFCRTVLPTLDDETALWGIDSVSACAEFYRGFGVAEVVIKAPGPECHVYTGAETVVQAADAVKAIDTTGAGDSFNAGYMASRCRGESIAMAISHAQRLAANVVQHRGAILPRVQ